MPATDDDFSLPPGIPRHWHAELSPPINIKSLVAPGRLTTLSEAVHYVDSKPGEMGRTNSSLVSSRLSPTRRERVPLTTLQPPLSGWPACFKLEDGWIRRGKSGTATSAHVRSL